MSIILTDSMSINDVERYYNWGHVSREQIVQYLRRWNAGPHFNQAVFMDGRIRVFDPELTNGYRFLYEEFGVRAISHTCNS